MQAWGMGCVHVHVILNDWQLKAYSSGSAKA